MTFSPMEMGASCIICGAHDFKRLFFKQKYHFVSCVSCGLVRLDPLPTPQQLDEHYERRAGGGNYHADLTQERIQPCRNLLRVIERARPGLPPGRVFDIGCLYGLFLDLARESGWETWGLEMQKSAAARAAENHTGRVFCDRIETFAACASTSSDLFDVVVASSVIEHLLDPAILFDLAKRLLKENGLLILQTPNHGSWLRRLMGKFWPPYAAPEHTFYFSAKNLKRFAEAMGFSVVMTKPDIKYLSIGFVLYQLRFFGEEIHRILAPLEKHLPPAILRLRLPFYGGEMFFIAYKK